MSYHCLFFITETAIIQGVPDYSLKLELPHTSLRLIAIGLFLKLTLPLNLNLSIFL